MTVIPAGAITALGTIESKEGYEAAYRGLVSGMTLAEATCFAQTSEFNDSQCASSVAESLADRALSESNSVTDLKSWYGTLERSFQVPALDHVFWPIRTVDFNDAAAWIKSQAEAGAPKTRIAAEEIEIVACRPMSRRAMLAGSMDKLFEELDFRKTPLGDLILQRRKYLQLDGRMIYEVKLGDAFLMSSLFHEVEVALSKLGLAALDGDAWDVVVGGLGLGYTAVAALEFHQLASLVVVDALEGVIEWHERELVPLGQTMNEDSRCRYVLGDFFGLAATPETGFDPQCPGRKFHAVLLDIDHSPRNLLASQNAGFYTREGLGKLAEHLHPGGVFALWSDDRPDAEFIADLESVFPMVRTEVVRFRNPLLDTYSESTVYVAKREGKKG